MAQTGINIPANQKIEIGVNSKECRQAADVLKLWLSKINSTEITISENTGKATIFIQESKSIPEQQFEISSNSETIFLTASDCKWLCYAAYTLLEEFGFRRFTASVDYIPENEISFPKNFKKIYKPSFEYRALAYPDCYDETFRDWHKLDWTAEDFGIWGHTFDKLLPPKEHFKNHPEYFALYQGQRRSESLCMSNDTVVKIVSKSLKKAIEKQPNARFYSLSQNDDIVFCECNECRKLNEKHGGPQGSLYYFLNRVAKQFPKTKITTLAYLHTYKPPTGLKIEPNIYTVFCPIELNHGKAIQDDATSRDFLKTLEDWQKTTKHLYLWDYTVQFSNYMSPFPNLQSFSPNYKLFENNKVNGIYAQGYSDVPGDLSELRQYLLAKLLWNSKIDIDATTDDFLRGFYGKAAPYIKQYLKLLEQNQLQSGNFLDIYSGPVQSRNSFLSVENMNNYDQVIEKAANAVKENTAHSERVEKLRLALEYAYFEQSKFYGKDQHGMFVTNGNERKVRPGLTDRVSQFTKAMKALNVYELSEGGPKPETYLSDWIEISKNTTIHPGEKAKAEFLVQPAEDFKGKGTYGLTDGAKGYKDFNINWTGWYGTNPEIEIDVTGIEFNAIKINFLEDQRHWIFPPKKVTITGFSDGKWSKIKSEDLGSLTEDYTVLTKTWEFYDKNLSRFTKIRVLVANQNELPSWRNRKNKKPMVMLDEIQLFQTNQKL